MGAAVPRGGVGTEQPIDCVQTIATHWDAPTPNSCVSLCSGSLRAASEAVQLHAGAVRGSERDEAIVEPQETAEVAQFPNEGRQAHGEPHFQRDFRRGEREGARS